MNYSTLREAWEDYEQTQDRKPRDGAKPSRPKREGVWRKHLSEPTVNGKRKKPVAPGARRSSAASSGASVGDRARRSQTEEFLADRSRPSPSRTSPGFVSPLLSPPGCGDGPGSWEPVPPGSELMASAEPWVPASNLDGGDGENWVPLEVDGDDYPAHVAGNSSGVAGAGVGAGYHGEDTGEGPGEGPGEGGNDGDGEDGDDASETYRRPHRGIAESENPERHTRFADRLAALPSEAPLIDVVAAPPQEATRAGGINDIFMYVFSGLLLIFLIEQAIQLGAAIGASRSLNQPQVFAVM